MKVIHIRKSDAAYMIFETDSGESAMGTAQTAQAIGEDQLRRLLAMKGASEKGVADVLRQLQNSNNAQLEI